MIYSSINIHSIQFRLLKLCSDPLVTLFCRSFLGSSLQSSLSSKALLTEETEDSVPKLDAPINPPAPCGYYSFCFKIHIVVMFIMITISSWW